MNRRKEKVHGQAVRESEGKRVEILVVIRCVGDPAVVLTKQVTPGLVYV